MNTIKTLISTFTVCLCLAGLSLKATDCTGIYYASNGVVLAGNNEDFWRPDTRMWFVPAEGNSFGRVYFGFSDMYPQGGMNDQGLFFDGFATFRMPMKDQTGKIVYRGNLVDKAMSECQTVAEVVSLFENFDLRFMESAMLMFGDKTGDSVIIEGDDILRKKGTHQVVTNFYQSRHQPQNYNCARYASANEVLNANPSVDVEVMRRALAATHIERDSPTQYSNIYDLTNGVIYLYHFHNYENVVVLNLAEELNKGKRTIEIANLFPETFAWINYQKEANDKLKKEIADRRDPDIRPWQYDSYPGRYGVMPGTSRWETVLVFRKKDKLMVQVDDQPAEEIYPERKDRFFHVDFNGKYAFEFDRDKDGEVTGLRFIGYGVAIKAERMGG